MGETINERAINCEDLLDDSDNRTAGQQNSRVWHSTVTINNCNTMPVTSVNGSMQDPDVPDGWNSRRRSVNVYRGLRLLDMSSQWKEFKNIHGQWTCFFCCHVRTGTIAIGFWHLMIQLAILSLMFIALFYPEFIKKSDDVFRGEHLEMYPADIQDVQAMNCTTTPCLLAAQGNGKLNEVNSNLPFSFGNLLSNQRLDPDDINMALFITVCTFVMTLLLIHGAAKGQPSQLMPFFFLQVFDFCISSMTMIGYMSYLPNVRQAIRERDPFPFQHQLLAMNKKCLTFFFILIFIVTFMVKGYCISIVWRCYKYLMGRCDGTRWTMRTTIGSSVPVDQESQTLVVGPDLPDYDTAMTDPQYRKKATLFPEPPPTYDMAMAAHHAQTHILADIQRSLDQPDDAGHSSTQNRPSDQRQ